MGKVLVLDDDEQICRIIERRLGDKFEKIITTTEPEEALSAVNSVDVLLIDQRMPNMEGIEFMKRVHSIDKDIPVIIMTAFGGVEEAIESIKSGAFHYITKPINFEELENILRRAIEVRKLKEKVRSLEEFLRFDIVAESPQMKRVLEIAKRVAPFDTTVLITGDSGVGKEVVAKFIHKNSPRAEKPFISINCAAMPENLLEAELFGYKKGSFSGAYSDKKGIVEEANGGTLFLDEIGDMPLQIQAKILRLLQNKEIKPIGSNKPKKVNVRILCATNRDLKDMVKQGKFREDLLYRINVIHVHIPPLRERKKDILPLATFFIRKTSEKFGVPLKRLSERAKAQLLSYPWPGNVRELENAIERSLILNEGEVIEEIFLESDIPSADYGSAEIEPYAQAKNRFEREYLEKLMELSGWNISKASRLSGKTRAEIYRLLKKHGLR